MLMSQVLPRVRDFHVLKSLGFPRDFNDEAVKTQANVTGAVQLQK